MRRARYRQKRRLDLRARFQTISRIWLVCLFKAKKRRGVGLITKVSQRNQQELTWFSEGSKFIAPVGSLVPDI